MLRIQMFSAVSRRAALVVLGVFWSAIGATGAHAQIGQIGGVGGPTSVGTHAPPIETSNIDLWQDLRQEGKNALVLGDWLVSPGAFVGGIYDSNPQQVSAGAKSTEGLRVTMNGLAERNNGITKTDLYGMADGRIYTSGNSNILTAQLGAIETYSPLPDWTFNAHGDYTRQTDLFDTVGVNHSVTTLNTTGIGLAPSTNPQTYNQLTGTASAEKRFSNLFADFSGSAVSQIYDKTSATNNANNEVYTGVGRGGVWMTPDIYGFVQGSGDSRNFDTGVLNSKGYTAEAGVGTGRIGLMQGEVYVGYQAEQFRSATIGTVGGLAYGGQIDYAPLPQLDLKLGVGTSIGAAQASATTGNGTKVTDVVALASYAIAPEWTATGRAGYIYAAYQGTNRVDNSWTMGPTLTYSVWRNFGLTLDYQHIETTSNVAPASFSRDVVTVGVSYKY